MLAEYHKVNGNYPTNYLLAIPQDEQDYYNIDSWGNNFFYVSNNSSFTLVSFGKGGSPDSFIYSRLPFPLTVHKQPTDAISVLGQYEEDQVVTNKGWYSSGGK